MDSAIAQGLGGASTARLNPHPVQDAPLTASDFVVAALGPSLIACWMGLYLCAVFVTATPFYDFSLAFACGFALAAVGFFLVSAAMGKATRSHGSLRGRVVGLGKPLCIAVSVVGCISQLVLALHIAIAPSPVLIALTIACSGIVMLKWASAQSGLMRVSSGVGLALCLALAALLLVLSLGLSCVAGSSGNYAVRSSSLLAVLAFVPLASAALVPPASSQDKPANAPQSPDLELSRETEGFVGGAMLTLSWAGISLVAFFATGFLSSPFWTDFSRMLDALIVVLLAAMVVTVAFVCIISKRVTTRAKVPSTRVFVQAVAVLLVISGLIAYFMLDGAGTSLGLSLIAAADVVCAHMILAIGTGKLRRCRIIARLDADRRRNGDAECEAAGESGAAVHADNPQGPESSEASKASAPIAAEAHAPANGRFAQLCLLFAAMLALAVAVIFFGVVLRQTLGLDASTVKNLVLCLVVVLLVSTGLTAFYSLRLLEAPEAAPHHPAADTYHLGNSREHEHAPNAPSAASGAARQSSSDIPPSESLPNVDLPPLIASSSNEGYGPAQPIVIDANAVRLARKRDFLASCGLTDRQADIALCFGDGLTMADTAEALDISINTVRYHMKTLYEKTGTEGKSDLRKKLEEVSSSPRTVLMK